METHLYTELTLQDHHTKVVITLSAKVHVHYLLAVIPPFPWLSIPSDSKQAIEFT